MDAIVTAGGTFKPEDPLFELTGIKKKALIPLAGKQMVTWVLEAIRGSELVENIVLAGLEADELDFEDDRLFFVPSAGSLVDNVFAGLHKLQDINPELQKLFIFSSDIPLVTPEIVRGFVEECSPYDGDMYYAVVTQETMEETFPDSNRTFVPFKGGRYSGGDAFYADVAAARGNKELAYMVTGSRKNAFQQARMIGFDFIIRFLFRTMTVHEAARRASKKVGFDGRVVITRFAELGMDADKLHQYEMIKSILDKRSG